MQISVGAAAGKLLGPDDLKVMTEQQAMGMVAAYTAELAAILNPQPGSKHVYAEESQHRGAVRGPTTEYGGWRCSNRGSKFGVQRSSASTECLVDSSDIGMGFDSLDGMLANPEAFADFDTGRLWTFSEPQTVDRLGSRQQPAAGTDLAR